MKVLESWDRMESLISFVLWIKSKSSQEPEVQMHTPDESIIDQFIEDDEDDPTDTRVDEKFAGDIEVLGAPNAEESGVKVTRKSSRSTAGKTSAYDDCQRCP